MSRRPPGPGRGEPPAGEGTSDERSREHAARGRRRPDARPPAPASTGGREAARLARLVELGRALAGATTLEDAGAAVWATLSTALPLRMAVLLVDVDGDEHALTWRSPGTGSAELADAVGHTRNTLAYLARRQAAATGRARRRAPRGSAAGAQPTLIPLEPSFVTVPLVIGGGRIVGVLLAEGVGLLTGSDLAFVGAVAGAIASDVHRRLAWQEAAGARDAARRLEALQQISRAVLERESLPEALPGVLRAICALFATEVAAVYLASEDGATLRRIASVGLRMGGDLELRVGVGAAGVIAARGHAMYDDVHDLEQVSPSLVESGARALIGAPLRAGGKLIGVVYTASREPRRFTRDEIQLIDLVAVRIASVIERARLLDGQRRLSRQLERVGKAFVGIADLAGAPATDLTLGLRAVAREARRVAAADAAALWIGDEAGSCETLVLEGFSSAQVARLAEVPGASGLLEQAALVRAPVRGADLRADPTQRGVAAYLPEMGPYLGVPIRRHRARIGTLYLVKRACRRPFTIEDQRAIELLTAHAGVAVENVRLYAAVATERRRFRLLAEASDALSRSLDPDQTLQIVAEQVVGSLADWCVVDRIGPDGRERLATACADPARQADVARLLAEPAAADRPAGRGAVVLDGSSRMAAPIVVRDQVVGMITLGRFSDGGAAPRRLGPDDVILAEELGRRAAIALDNADHHRKALEAVRSRDVMMGVVSHDLRSPLGNIQMRAEVVGERFPGARRHTEKITTAVTRMERLIRDLLAVGSIEAGTLTIERGRESGASIAREAIESIALSAARKEIAVELVVAEPDLPLACDRGRILQVLQNLLGNAVKFTGPGGTVTLSLADAGPDLARFSVADTGRGIAPADLARVFDRYWQARETSRQGVGLGLSIARGIVEAHGGAIEVRSAPGEGATFSFTIPLAGDDDAPRPDDPARALSY